MSRFNKAFKALGFLVVLGGLATGVVFVPRLLGKDPFASFQRPEGPLGGQVGIQLKDVEVKHYQGANLVSQAKIDQVDVRQDRQYLDFFGIREGMFQSKDGSFNFGADQANFNAISREIEVTRGSHIFNKDFDLKTESFKYDQNKKMVQVPGNIQGRLFEGELQAKNFKFNLTNQHYSLGRTQWVGMVQNKEISGSLPVGGASRQQQSGPEGKTRWAIDSDSMRGTPTTEIYTNGSATDGEILVKAPRIEREKRSDVITATGKVYYFSEKANLVCDKAVIYQKEKRAVLTGNVRMLVKPKDQEKLDFTEVAPFEPLVPNRVLNDRPAPPPSAQVQQQKDLDDELRTSKTIRKYPVKIQAARVEYWYAPGQRRATITGNPQARQELASGRWRHIWTYQAFYDGEKETLRLVSDKDKRDTRMKNSLEDDLIAQAVTISTREEDEDYEVEKPKGFVHTDPQDDPRDRRGGSSAPPPPATTGGGTGGTGGGGRS